jgi:spore maturation protein CgeB
VAEIVEELTPEEAVRIGERARERVLREHTYARRAQQVHRIIADFFKTSRTEAAE